MIGRLSFKPVILEFDMDQIIAELKKTWGRIVSAAIAGAITVLTILTQMGVDLSGEVQEKLTEVGTEQGE